MRNKEQWTIYVAECYQDRHVGLERRDQRHMELIKPEQMRYLSWKEHERAVEQNEEGVAPCSSV